MPLSTTPHPRVAICVCTHSRSDVLIRLLGMIEQIDLKHYDPAQVEMIVIDNRPNAETRRICEQAGPRLPINLHYSPEPTPGITYARNHAVAVALERGADLLAFIDDDDQPRSDWLAQLLDRQAATGADLVFGTWILDENMPDWARKTGIFRSPSKSKQEKKGGRYGLPDYASTCNLLVGRAILERVGEVGPIFSHDFCNSGGEDKDFFIRAHSLGANLATAEGSVIHRRHEAERYTAKGLIKRGFKNGCSGVNMARHHGDGKRLFKIQMIALAKLFISLILLPFSIFSKGFFMHSLYRMAKSCGTIYTTVTGRSFKYYSR